MYQLYLCFFISFLVPTKAYQAFVSSLRFLWKLLMKCRTDLLRTRLGYLTHQAKASERCAYMSLLLAYFLNCFVLQSFIEICGHFISNSSLWYRQNALVEPEFSQKNPKIKWKSILPLVEEIDCDTEVLLYCIVQRTDPWLYCMY